MKKKILLSILLISCCCYVFTQSCESIGLYEKLQPTKKKGVQFPYKDQFEVTNLEGKSIRLFQNVDEIIEILGEPDSIDIVFKNPAKNKEDYDILELVYDDGLRCRYYRRLKDVFRIELTSDKYFLSDDKICINHFGLSPKNYTTWKESFSTDKLRKKVEKWRKDLQKSKS